MFPGYWREVLNQNVTPNEAYINVTMDNSCVVQIERQEIQRLYDEFQEEKLSDQDHVLVDVHLSTFAEATNPGFPKVERQHWRGRQHII